MKKIIFAFILVYTTLSLPAQTPNQLSPGGKKKLDELSQEAKKIMQGVWTGRSGEDSVVLYIVQTSGYMDQLPPGLGESITPLYGWHKIFRDGKVVESSGEFASNAYNNMTTIITAYKRNQDSVYMALRDITRERYLEGIFVLPSDSSNTAILTVRKKLECFTFSDKKYIPGQTFPSTITLKRISPTIDEMILTRTKQQ